MHIATASLKSVSPYSPSRMYTQEVPKLQRESDDQYEERTWRNRCHVDGSGHVVIPAVAFKGALCNAGDYLKHKIPGENRATFAKPMRAGTLILEPMVLPVKVTEVECEKLFLSPRGIKGQRGVWKTMPVIHEWKGNIEIHVLDDKITKDELESTLIGAGQFIGIGRWRPINGGTNGRFELTKLKWN